jgi:hypothetical protein
VKKKKLLLLLLLFWLALVRKAGSVACRPW